MLRLLRCRFWKSNPWRLPPMPSPARPPGISILMAWAPQSTSWRTHVGPARAREVEDVEASEGEGAVVFHQATPSSMAGARDASGVVPAAVIVSNLMRRMNGKNSGTAANINASSQKSSAKARIWACVTVSR